MRVQDTDNTIPGYIYASTVRIGGNRMHRDLLQPSGSDRRRGEFLTEIRVDHTDGPSTAIGDKSTTIINRKHDACRLWVRISQ